MRKLCPLLLLCLLLTGCAREASPEPGDYSRALARDMGRRYGIQVLFGTEAADLAPWDYEFTPEPVEALVYRQLSDLDRDLGRFPKGLLQKLFSPSVTVCVVKEIAGVPGSGSVKAASGLQFEGESGVILALAGGPDSDRALYHELYHLMAPHLALENWEALNPEGFAYQNSYTPPEDPALAQGDDRAFVDEYSMSYPKEDQARIFEYAMEGGNEALFQSEILQTKLGALCAAIREAYDLEGDLPWEQYLHFPS